MFFVRSAHCGSVSSQPTRRRDRWWRSLALAVVLALGSMPTAVWAKAPGASSAQVSPNRPASPATQVPAAADARTTQQEYASREASAASQAKFEGGDTVVWVGGSTLVIVLLVILIVVLI